MAKTVIVTSCKGGVGKSTVTAGISAALALSGKRALAIDFDFTVRGLELLLGVENSTVFNWLDVMDGRCDLSRAIIPHGKLGGLYFLAAPRLEQADASSLDFHGLFGKIKDFRDDGKEFDYVIADVHGKDSDTVRKISEFCDKALVLCDHSPASVRAAELTGELLRDCGVGDSKLLINSFDADGALRGNRTGIIELIDTSRLMLAGVVPYDKELELLGENGELIDALPKASNTGRAFMNITARLEGDHVPLFNGFAGGVYKKLLQGK